MSPRARPRPLTTSATACYCARMRGLPLTTLLLAACSMANPLFGVSSETDIGSSGDAPSTGTTPPSPTTGDPTAGTTAPPTTSGPGSTTAPDTDTGPITTIEPGTGTTAPDTDGTTLGVDTSDSAGSTTGTTGTTGDSTTGEPQQCALPDPNLALSPYVLKNGQPLAPIECAQEFTTLRGRLKRTGGTLTLTTDNECSFGVTNLTYTLGTNLELPDDGKQYGCTDALIVWDEDAKCKLGTLRIYLKNNPAGLLYAAAFRVEPPVSFPLHADASTIEPCGCPNDPEPCCMDPEAGQLSLTPDGGQPILQHGHGYAKSGQGIEFEFYNLQSWMGPECNDGGGRHIDWIAEVTEL